MEPIQNDLLAETAVVPEATDYLKNRAIESFIFLREDIPPKPLFPNAEDPFREQREKAEQDIKNAIEGGITLENIQEEAKSKKMADILKAYIEHEKLYYDTDGFALGKLNSEQITRKATLEKTIKKAPVWETELDEIEKQAAQTIKEYATRKKGIELEAAQQADLDMWKMCDAVVLSGESIHDLSPENQQIVEKAMNLARRVKFGQHPPSNDEVEAKTSQYRQEKRPVFLEKARQISQEIEALQKSLGTEGTVFRLDDITQNQLDKIYQINNFVFYARTHYYIFASELGVKYFGTLGVHDAYQDAKLKKE